MNDENAKLNFLHVCENVISPADGKVSVISIFNRIFAKSFPAVHPRFSVVSNITASVGDHIEIIEILSPTGEMIVKAEDKVNIDREGGANNFIANFVSIIFPEEGEYKIRVKVDNKVISEDNYIILKQIRND